MSPRTLQCRQPPSWVWIGSRSDEREGSGKFQGKKDSPKERRNRTGGATHSVLTTHSQSLGDLCCPVASSTTLRHQQTPCWVRLGNLSSDEKFLTELQGKEGPVRSAKTHPVHPHCTWVKRSVLRALWVPGPRLRRPFRAIRHLLGS